MGNKSQSSSALGYWIIGGVTVAVFAFIILASVWSSMFPLPLKPSRVAAFDCIQHRNLALHIHPVLTITVKGEKVEIPANVGINASCMRALHTHDDTGVIHIEHSQAIEFSLGDFFAVWGKDMRSFGQDIVMKVNGVENTEYENYIMKDKDIIELTFE